MSARIWGRGWLRPLVGCLAVMACGVALASDPDARALAQAVHDRPDGGDAVMKVTMTLAEDGRSPRVRGMVTYRRETAEGDIHTLIRFTDPADIAGTGLLTHDLAAGDSNQWIYLPAMKRVRRVDSNRKGGRFVNSDYYFEDLRTRQVDMDAHRLVGRGTAAGVECELLESIPVDADNSVYRKRLSCIDRDTLLPMRVDFFENNVNTPSKRLEVVRYEQIQGYWTVRESVMRDLEKAHETRLITEQVLYDQGLPDALFGTRALEDDRTERRYRP
ncbi:MAG: outer membrane lipoprotein-sorting protein [Rhodocyclaceae bacterium]